MGTKTIAPAPTTGASSTAAADAAVPAGFPRPEALRMGLLPPYLLGRINAHNDELRAKGVDVIDLGMGNPVDPVQPEVVQTMIDSLKEVKNHRYSQAKGILPLKQAFSRHYQRHYHVDLDPNKEVIATIGSKEAFSHLCLAILGPQDACVVPTPAFTIHMYAPIIAGANPIGVFMSEENPGAKLLGDIKRVFESVRPRPKFLVLNFPHNPTAKTVDLAFYEEAVAMAKHFRFWLLNDFAYGHSCFDGYKAPSILQVKGAKDVAVETFTMSKPYNMAGWRVGFLAGNPLLVDCLARIKGYFDYGIFQSIQLAAATALDEGDGLIKAQAALYQKRRDALLAGLEANGWGPTVKNRATMFTWQRLPEKFRHMNSVDFSFKLAAETGVSFTPGGGFGEEGEGCLRMALVDTEARIQEACKRVGAFLKK
ncbi:MAG: aminotransferase class I/II-fold pyridoxal phosphate-dependent enzyme [Planctomycetota bacterium]|nr:aminotransferase class I/II-fold pyridoxal phosphate-dependent enzyme [Planctomycetota bacterium]